MKIKDELKHNDRVLSLYKEIIYYKTVLEFRISPKLPADRTYHKVFHRHINWKNPKDLIEKISWMQLNTDTSLWTECADKYRVRSYVERQGLSYILNKLYGHWNSADDIDFDQLPNSFVLKANNGCGSVFVVKDKTLLDVNMVKKTLSKWISRPFGYASSQLHYIKIHPCIIAEELLVQSADECVISPNSLIDYKIWCFQGVPECILVVYNRDKQIYSLLLYDLNWNKISNNLFKNNHYSFNDIDIPRPICLDQMLQIACTLSQPFPEVRVDFYVIDNKPYFGELTFSTGYGYFTKEYYEYLGNKIDLRMVPRIK